MGAGGRRRMPMSFYSTDVENPKKAHVAGCVTQMLLIFGCILFFGSISVIINGIFREFSIVMYIGFAMLALGAILLISSFIVCGAVLKHVCCHPGKPTLGQIHLQARNNQFVNVPMANMQQPNSGFPNMAQPPPAYGQPPSGFVPTVSGYGQPQNDASQAPPGGYPQPTQSDTAPPTYASATGDQYKQDFGMQDESKKF